MRQFYSLETLTIDTTVYKLLYPGQQSAEFSEYIQIDPLIRWINSSVMYCRVSSYSDDIEDLLPEAPDELDEFVPLNLIYHNSGWWYAIGTVVA